MSLKDKTRTELEQRIHELEDKIRKNGIGSGYLKKAERIQRNVNLGLIFGGAFLLGVSIWALSGSSEKREEE